LGSKAPSRFWNRLPENVKEQWIEKALAHSDKAALDVSHHLTGYNCSV